MLVVFADEAGRRGLVTVRDFLPHLLLAQSPEIFDDIVRRVFDCVEGADRAATLQCLAATSFDRGASAAELVVHRNTLLYRPRSAEPVDQNLVYLAALWTRINPPPTAVVE